MFDYHITAESFGSDLPENWEEIAAFLNEMIDDALDGNPDAFMPGYDDTGLSAEGHEIIDNICERWCAGEIDGAPEPIL